MELHYCDKHGVVKAVPGKFWHPHLGMKPCFSCPKCGGMVYTKDEKNLA